MIQIATNLFVGDQDDYKQFEGSSEFKFVQAAKEPWHRKALGYKGKSAPKDHPEYLYAFRDSRLILNLVDASKKKYFQDEIFQVAHSFIKSYKDTWKVLVHCNKGQSRAPGVVLYYLWKEGFVPSNYREAVDGFSVLYPTFQPSDGLEGFLKEQFNK